MHTLENSGGAPSNRDVLTAQQLRAARALVGWSRSVLAAKSKTSAVAIENFERGITSPRLITAGQWRLALERAGVIFIDADADAGPGVRLRDGAKRP